MSAPAASRPEPRDYLTILLVSVAVMLYQITLTRVLSVVVWYHFAFLTVSMVMLGFGAPGVWFALSRNPLRYLPGFLLAAAISIPASVVLIVKLGSALFSHSVAWIVLCVMPVTLSLGGVVCLLLIKAGGRAIDRMYGIDLLGAGLGAMLVIPLMHAIPTPHIAAGTALLPAACLLLRVGALRRVGIVLLALIVALLVQGEGLRVTRSKSYDEKAVPPIYERWTPTARLTVFDDRFFSLAEHAAGFSWGRGSRFPQGQEIEQLWLEQDGSAGTPITAYDGDLARLSYLFYDVTTVGYQLRPPDKVAVVGAGGGRDILSALLAGADEVHAVELNPYTIDLVSERFAEISGDVYHAPGVVAVAGEGRSFLTHTEERFDLIQISLIDSWAASAAGAFALAENNLYTVEAFRLYGERLDEHGLLSTSRFTTEVPRLVLLGREALLAAGVEDPARHMALISAQSVVTLLVSKAPFDLADLRRLDEICAHRGFERWLPVAPGETPLRPRLVDTAAGRVDWMSEMGLSSAAPTDDRPYFFQLLSPFTATSRLADNVRQAIDLNTNLQSARVLRQVVLVVVPLALLLFLLPFVARLGAERAGEPLAGLVRATLYFAAIGAAFMLIENVMLQRFVLYLGHPSYATTVVIATLLLGMGVGSTRATRVGLRRLRRYGLVVPLALVALVVLLPPLFAATLGQPRPLRILLSCALLVPLGGALGLFFPLGMSRFGDASKAWYWAINGVFGVVAGVLSLALSMEFGFTVVGVLGAAGYLGAWICLGGAGARTRGSVSR